MSRREEIEQQINANKQRISQLRGENKELTIESLQLCDEKQWYTEKMESRPVGRGRSTISVKVGRIHWNEDFIDEDTGEAVNVERSEVVREDDKWCSYRILESQKP